MVGVLEGVALGPDVGDWTAVGDFVDVGGTAEGVSVAVGDAGTIAEGTTVGSCAWALEVRL